MELPKNNRKLCILPARLSVIVQGSGKFPCSRCARKSADRHGCIQRKDRDEKCRPLPEKPLPGHRGVFRICPGHCPEKPVRVHILHDRAQKPPAYREDPGDVHREVRVSRQEPRAGGIGLGGLPHAGRVRGRYCCRCLEHRKRTGPQGKGKTHPRCRSVLRNSPVP